MENKKMSAGSITLIIIVLLVLIGGGYYFYQKQQSKVVVSPGVVVLPEDDSIVYDKNTGIITMDADKDYKYNGTVPNTKTVVTNLAPGVSVTVGSDTNIKADIEVEAKEAVDCGSEDCFQQKFTTCQPAILQSDAGFASVNYRIIESVTGGCKMTFKYTTNPNPDWVNKEMTCTFNNKIDFQDSIEATFNGILNGSVVCEGPLYSIMRSM